MFCCLTGRNLNEAVLTCNKHENDVKKRIKVISKSQMTLRKNQVLLRRELKKTYPVLCEVVFHVLPRDWIQLQMQNGESWHVALTATGTFWERKSKADGIS